MKSTDPPDRTPEEQAELDKYLREVYTRNQAKTRRQLDGDGSRRQVRLDQLPLFADEKSLSEAIMGRGRYTEWRSIVPILEHRGLPKIDALMGGRYWPAVKAFFDREYKIHRDYNVPEPHRPADLGATWKIRDARKAAKRKGYVEPEDC